MTSIAGFQILRVLGRGSRADVLLGHASVPGSDPLLAALKRFHPGEHVSALREAQTLARLDHPHVQTVLDLATAPSGESVLILPRLDPGGLAAWLTSPRTLSAGEVVTAAAPLVGALEHLHSRGVTHTRIGAHKVLFDPAGAPILCGFSDSQSVGEANADAGVGASASALLPPVLSEDWRACWAIVDELSSRVDTPSAALIDMVRWGSEAPWDRDLDAFAREALDRLFALAEPLPLRLHSAPGTVQVASRIRQVQAVATDSATRPALVRRTQEDMHEVRAAGRVVARSRRVFQRLLSSFVWCRHQLGGVRRGFWVAGVAGLLSIGAIVGLGAAAAPEKSRGQEVTRGEVSNREVAGETQTGPGWHGDVPSDAPVPVDPVEAARVLVKDATHGGRFVDANSLVVADVLGDTALLTGFAAAETVDEQTAPASVLLIRTEAGWRLRRLIIAD